MGISRSALEEMLPPEEEMVGEPAEDTPLHNALEGGDLEQAQALLRPLHAAALSHQEEIIIALCNAGADVNEVGEYGATPLHWAVYSGHTKSVQALLDHGADPNAADDKGGTSLHWAAFKDLTEIVHALLAAGADFNHKNKAKLTPLHAAVVGGHLEMVNTLLVAGAAPDEGDNGGKTPLHLAVSNGNRAMAIALLAAGADPNKAREKLTVNDDNAGVLKELLELLDNYPRVAATWKNWHSYNLHDNRHTVFSDYRQWLPEEVMEDVLDLVTNAKQNSP